MGTGDPQDTRDAGREPSAHETAEVVPEASDSASELARVLDDYAARLQAKERPDREEILRLHPALAGRIERCLEALDFIDCASTELASGAPAHLGDFRILREIGRGGMGVVYEAEQVSLKRKVALKVLRFGPASDPEAMKRFQREAETVAGLHHTNIVPIFAVGSERGLHYYAMQYIAGESIAEAMEKAAKEGRVFAPRQAAAWGLETAEALDHAHQRGVIHRDVKPSNLLLDRDGRIWLTDFGLAKRAEDVTLSLTGALLGTPRYMSPEQASAAKHPVDHRTDLYSLGATLYEIATGKPVFEAATAQGVISRILAEEPVPPRRIAPGIPRDLETIILTCLAKDPEKRYATARGLAADLRAFSEDRRITARRPGVIERSARWLRKERRAVAAAAASVAAAALLAAAGFGLLHLDRVLHLGRVHFTTDGPPLTAEVLRGEEDEAAQRVPVPSREPARLPSGSYLVRFSAAGLLSETAALEVAPARHEPRGVMWRIPVDLEERRMGKPIPIQRGDRFQVLDLGGGPDIVLATHTGVRVVKRFRGSTGEQVWEERLAFKPPENVRAAGGSDLWTLLNGSWGAPAYWPAPDRDEKKPSWLDPPPDLDGDGTGDLVWIARHAQALMALSGKDGKVLACRKLEPGDEPLELTPGDPDRGSPASRVPEGTGPLEPVLADLDGDGVREVIVPWRDPGDAERSLGIEVLGARDGNRLWRRLLWTEGKAPWEDARNAAAGSISGLLAAPDLDGDGRRDLVVASVGTLPAEPHAFVPHDTGGTRRMEKVFLFVDVLSGHDGATLSRWQRSMPLLSAAVKLLLWQTDAEGWPQLVVPITGDRPPHVLVLSLRSGRLRHVLDGASRPLARDLDGDGILDLAYETNLSSGFDQPEKLELRVARGTPPELWRRLGRWVPASDFDGDGLTDVLSAGASEIVTAASGGDGRVLWKTHVRWNESRLGGHQFHEDPYSLADLDGDGAADLFFSYGSYIAPFPIEKRVALPLQAVSGRSGRRLWYAGDLPRQASGHGHLRPLVLRARDMDADGEAEVLCIAQLVVDRLENGSIVHDIDKNQEWIAVLAGKTGRVIWAQPLTPEAAADARRTMPPGGAEPPGLDLVYPTDANQKVKSTVRYGQVGRPFAGDVAAAEDVQPPFLHQPDPRWARLLPWSQAKPRDLSAGTLLPMMLFSFAVFVAPLLIYRRAVRRRSSFLRSVAVGLFVLPAVLALGQALFEALLGRGDGSPFRSLVRDTFQLYLEAALCLPITVFLWRLLIESLHRRWQQVFLLLGFSATLAVAGAIPWLLLDARRMLDGEYYAANDWYGVWLLGASGVGFAYLLRLAAPGLRGRRHARLA